MKKQNHKSFPARTATLLFAALLAHLSTWGQNSVSTITTSENITKKSTVYAGEVVVDGVTMTKYLFSDNMSRKEDVITNLLSGLQGMTDGSYAMLLNGTEADVEATGLALCSDPELIAAMDKNWSSAQYVGTLYFSGKTVLSETNSNLYDIDEGFKAALDVQTAARAENIENLADVKKCIVTHLDSRTVTDVWYNIIDGSTVRHYDTNVIYDSEATTVIYTKVELTTGQTCSLLGDMNGDGQIMVNDIVKLAAHVKGIRKLDDSINADVNGDNKVNVTDVVMVAAHVKGIRKLN